MLADLLKECGAIKFGEFILTSGKKSDYYIDIKKASTDPTILKEISKEMKKHVEGYELIAGMELGAVPIAVALSMETGLPYVIVRKEKKGHGMARQIEGRKVKEKRVLVVEDVTTTGGSLVKAIDILMNEGAIVDRAIVVVDRESGAAEKLDEIGVEFISLVKIGDLL